MGHHGAQVSNEQISEVLLKLKAKFALEPLAIDVFADMYKGEVVHE